MDVSVRSLVDRLVPIDDLMFRKMAEDVPFCQELLRTILGDAELRVEGLPIPQASVTNLQGRSAVLDAYCVLGNGRRINIEVQSSPQEDFQRRVRYYASLLTANVTEPGTLFKDIPDVCIVYISQFDPFGAGLTTYHVDRVVRETGVHKYNGMSEVYVDATRRNDSAVSRLMRILVDPGVYDYVSFPQTSRRKRVFMDTEEGKRVMCELVEEYAQSVARQAAEQAAALALQKGREQGVEQGIEQGLERGIEQGIEQGIERGIERGRTEALRSLVEDGLITADVAAARLGMSEEAFQAQADLNSEASGA